MDGWGWEELSPALGIIFAVGNVSVLGIGFYVASGFFGRAGRVGGCGGYRKEVVKKNGFLLKQWASTFESSHHRDAEPTGGYRWKPYIKNKYFRIENCCRKRWWIR